jgi:hypothetical protein
MPIDYSIAFDGMFQDQMIDTSVSDRKVTEYQCDESVTSTQTNYKITIRDTDSFVHLSEGHLKVKLHVENADGTPATLSDNIALENNGVNLFEKTEFRLGDQKVDSLDYAGLTSLITQLSENDVDWTDSNGQVQMWVPDSNSTADSVKYVVDDTTAAVESESATYNEGYHRRLKATAKAVGRKDVTMLIPLRKMFPLLESHRHPFKGIRSSIHLWKNSDKNTLTRTGGSGDAKLIIDDISLFVPVLQPSLAKSVELDTQFAKGTPIPVQWDRQETIVSTAFANNASANTYRLTTTSEKPERIFVGFQLSDRLNDDQTKLSQVFDNLDVEYLHSRINSTQFPSEQYTPEWSTGDYVREYVDFTEARGTVLDATNGSSIPFDKYASVYPLYCIDCTKMPDSVWSPGSTADITLRFKLRTQPGASYHLVAVTESKARVELKPMSSERVTLVQ